MGLIISAPVPSDTPNSNKTVLVHAASSAAAGVIASYTVPAGVQAVMTSASMNDTDSTTAVLALQVVRGGVTTTILQGKTPLTWTGAIPLSAGDVVQWNVTTPFAASTADVVLGATQENVPSRITLSFSGAAVLDAGTNVYAGSLPLQLREDHIGQAITEEIRAIATPAAVTLGVLEILEP